MSGKNPIPAPLAYEGVEAPTPPNMTITQSAPTTAFAKRQKLGNFALNENTGNLYYLSAPNTWTVVAGSTADVNTINNLSPTGGNITIAGTANQVTVGSSGSTVTLSLPAAITAPGSLTATTTLTATLGDITATNGNLVLSTAGNKLSIATGADASVGTSAAMVAGTVTVNTTAVTASSLIFLTVNTPGGTQGTLSAPTASIVAGTSFVINSSSNTDTSTVNWWIVN
jgi:hypothetical protein